MAILPIRIYGDPVLRKKSEPVTEITPELRQLAKDMLFDGAVDTVGEALQLAQNYVSADPGYILMPTGSLTVPLYRP